MNYKPNDFFIGVIDFFAILLPGALLTFFIQAHWYDRFFGAGNVFPLLHTTLEKGLAFIIITYILGNIIFLIASLLDHLVYDRFLRATFFKKNADLTYLVATSIKETYLHSDDLIKDLQMRNRLSEEQRKDLKAGNRKEIINTYKFIQHFILLKKPEALTDIKKLEADSKFFRCLVIAFILIAGFSFGHSEKMIGFVFLFFSLLSLYRYGDLRNKSTQRAYEFLITCFYLTNDVKENSAVANINKLKESIQTNNKTAAHHLSSQLEAKYQPFVSQLKKGINKSIQQLTVHANETQPASFTADAEEIWYCLNGKGILQFDNSNTHILLPNTTITIAKDKTYTFMNKVKEPLELLVLKN